MQNALKISNNNAMELKETITECIHREKKLRQRIKDLEIENSQLKDLKESNFNEIMYKVKIYKQRIIELEDEAITTKNLKETMNVYSRLKDLETNNEVLSNKNLKLTENERM